jgi:hemolysin activation/secretion protein
MFGVRGHGTSISLVACLSAWLTVGVAYAQAIPPSVSPGQIEKNLQQQTLPEQHGAEINLPPQNSSAAPANAASLKFVLKRIDVEGAHAVPADEISETYKKLIGSEVTLADVYRVANQITALYVKHGYAISFAVVPAQTIDGSGQVRIDVVEGYVGEIQFAGDTAHIPDAVRAYADQIKQSRPLTNAAIERFLLVIDDVPGITATSTFERPAAHDRGATRLIINVAFTAVTASLNFDNRGSRAMGPYRTDDSVTLNSLLGYGDSLRLRVLQTLQWNELNYGSANWSIPVGSDGASLVLSGDDFQSRPGTAQLQSVDYKSRGWSVRGEADYPLLRSRAESLWLHGAVVAKQLSSDFAAVPDTRDRLFEADAGLTWWDNDDTGQDTAVADIIQGLPAFGATDANSPLRSRISGSGVFTLLSANAARTQNLSDGFQLYGTVLGQASSRGLLTAEQCGYGGETFGRGFDASEIAGDDCAEAAVELRYNPSGDYWDRAQFYAFGDAGEVWLNGTLLPGETRSSGAQSVGVGVRLDLSHGFSATAEYAQPLSRQVALEGNRNGRVFFSISKGF